jgi:hypothetical protein
MKGHRQWLPCMTEASVVDAACRPSKPAEEFPVPDFKPLIRPPSAAVILASMSFVTLPSIPAVVDVYGNGQCGDSKSRLHIHDRRGRGDRTNNAVRA